VTNMKAWPKYPVIFEINTWVWLRGLGQKWLRGGVPAGGAFVGSADIQSLADLGNSFEIVRRMGLVPFTKSNVIQLAEFTLLPLLPLALTMVSLEELLGRLRKVVF